MESTPARRAEVVLVRHGETAWTVTGQHTSRTDVPLTDRGRRDAVRLGERLSTRSFGLVLTSPRQRASETCRLAGLADLAETSEEVAEWDYGDYEGWTTRDIRHEVAEWSLWTDGVPNGETAAQVAQRADRVIDRLRAQTADTVVVSHGHFLRVLAARWVELEAADGRSFALAPASVSALGWEREQPVITLWNEVVA